MTGLAAIAQIFELTDPIIFGKIIDNFAIDTDSRSEQELGSIILAYREAEASLQIFSNLMKKEPEYRPDEPVEIGDIENLRFENVSFRYKKADHDAIGDLSFSARIGETIAFAGPSGCGKSTLVKLLVGLYPPTRGTIYFDEVQTKDRSSGTGPGSAPGLWHLTCSVALFASG
ncbi:MAG: ATP-binding cassette domain-containing protein [Bacteroidales bacterium]